MRKREECLYRYWREKHSQIPCVRFGRNAKARFGNRLPPSIQFHHMRMICLCVYNASLLYFCFYFYFSPLFLMYIYITYTWCNPVVASFFLFSFLYIFVVRIFASLFPTSLAGISLSIVDAVRFSSSSRFQASLWLFFFFFFFFCLSFSSTFPYCQTHG